MQTIFKTFVTLIILFFLNFVNLKGNDISTVKVLTYNIWNGFDWGKDLERKNDCINWIASQDPDVVTLQELCGYTEEMLKEDALKWGHQYSVLLKTSGYPTGITSNEPIELVEKVLDPFWHGLLHCKTYGIDFFVVHLSPADSDFRLKEAKIISAKIGALDNDKYIISGDFNAHSPFDASFLESKTSLRIKRTPKPDDKYSNLRLGQFDYSAMSEILGSPSIDVCIRRKNLEESFTFPSPVLDGLYSNTLESIKKNKERIDYILASPELAINCTQVEVFNGQEASKLSDHYPMMAEFSLKASVE